MKNRLQEREAHLLPSAAKIRAVVATLMLLLLGSCASQAAKDAEIAVVEAERFFRHDAKSNDVSIAFHLADSLPKVSADLIELEQLIINVCRNAIEAMREGEAPRTLDIETSYDDGSVRVVIADTGPGLAAGQIDEVWQPFFTTKERGLGLGLAICRSIVEAHGGKIRAEKNFLPSWRPNPYISDYPHYGIDENSETHSGVDQSIQSKAPLE